TTLGASCALSLEQTERGQSRQSSRAGGAQGPALRKAAVPSAMVRGWGRDRLERAEHVFAEKGRRNGALLHEGQVEGLEGEAILQPFRRLAPHCVDGIPSQPVGNGLGGPARITVDRALRAV